ncbi:DNA methyltransferase [Fibrobacteres bacterium R8-0-B4]
MPTLHWLTRDDDLKTAGKAQYRLLTENEEYSCGDTDSGNIIVQGDNLEALKALLPFYAGQVKCVYIDPPYNTGAKYDPDGNNMDYDDNLEHTMWLSMMYPRLDLLRQFLSEDGGIFISIDNKEHAYLKVLCDEIFGRNNFRSNIIWKKVSSAKAQSNYLGNVVEYILFYSKSDHCIFYPQYIKGDDEKDSKNYPYVEEETGRRYGSFDFTQKGQGEPKIFWGKKLTPPSGKHWIWTQEKIDEGIKDGLIFKTKSGLPRLKRYLDIKQGNYLSDMWNDMDVAPISANSKEAMDFFGQKSEGLIKRVLELSTQPGDLILDSFLGSGTAAAVAHKMRRRYIGIEMGKQAKTHCVPRLQKVIDGEQGGISKSVNWQGGGGFRFYTLGDPVFNDDGQIRASIKFDQLAAHVWFYETKTPIGGHRAKSKDKSKARSPFLGVHGNTAYALLYNGILHDASINGGNVLTSKTLAMIYKSIGRVKYDKLVIYGEASRLGSARLKASGIVFKQIPYDVRAR